MKTSDDDTIISGRKNGTTKQHRTNASKNSVHSAKSTFYRDNNCWEIVRIFVKKLLI
jgi:hypothetical protein